MTQDERVVETKKSPFLRVQKNAELVEFDNAIYQQKLLSGICSIEK